MKVPILKQGDYLIASVQSVLSDSDLVLLRNVIAERVGKFRSRGVIIDVTALDVMDSYAARTKPLREILTLIGLASETQALIEANNPLSGLECECDSPRAGKLFIKITVTSGPLEKEEALFLVVEDITEQKKFLQEMSRLEQMNIIGEMAAGIGHEIRNPMTAIRGFLQLLTARKNYSEDQEYFELMIEELDRANAIITEFLSLARNKIVTLNKQNLNEILETLKPLLEAAVFQTDNFLEIHLDEIPDLLLHEKEIRQLILNLVRNGREAMAGSKGKTLTIRTYQEGDEVILAVQDQGKGIEPHMLDKLGTPFLTTKENGTGLGLPVCYNIAARHQAIITVETGSAGTTFFVRFKQPQFNSETA
ncbi:MAG: ATP-binding protein [Desulfitobacteriia bacterium]